MLWDYPASQPLELAVLAAGWRGELQPTECPLKPCGQTQVGPPWELQTNPLGATQSAHKRMGPSWPGWRGEIIVLIHFQSKHFK